MKRRPKIRGKGSKLRADLDHGTRYRPVKNQGYQLPVALWQDLSEEAGRRRRLGLDFDSQNAIAVAAISAWLENHKGGE